LSPLTWVFLPGMDGTGDLFDPLVGALPPGTRVVIARYPMDASAGYDALVRVARAAAPADGDHVIVGESFSGPIALALAAEGSSRLRGVVLCCTFLRDPRPGLTWLAPLLRPAVLRLLATRWATRRLLGAWSSEQLVGRLNRVLRSVPAAVLRTRLLALRRMDASAEARAIRVPVLVMQARQDRLVSARHIDQLADAFPHAHRVIVDGPHFLLQANPVEASACLTRFADTLE
jgi:pimeloyl-ACP methyl ester carboxylesterase